MGKLCLLFCYFLLSHPPHIKLIMRSTNPCEVAIIFTEYARKIHAKVVPSDPNFHSPYMITTFVNQHRKQMFRVRYIFWAVFIPS